MMKNQLFCRRNTADRNFPLMIAIKNQKKNIIENHLSGKKIIKALKWMGTQDFQDRGQGILSTNLKEIFFLLNECQNYS